MIGDLLERQWHRPCPAIGKRGSPRGSDTGRLQRERRERRFSIAQRRRRWISIDGRCHRHDTGRGGQWHARAPASE